MNVQRGTSTIPAGAPLVGPREGTRRQRRPLSLVENSLALIAAKFATLGLGFVFWLLAARLFERTEMGVAAAVVSAVMLCTQLALLGVGSSVITLLRDHLKDPERLIHSALAVVVVVAAAGAVVFVAFVGLAVPGLDVVAGSVSYAALFVVAVVCGAIGTLLDQTSTGLRRGDQALARGIVFGLTTIAAVAAFGSAGAEGSQAIFLAWAIAGPPICVLGWFQLRRLPPRFRWRLSPERGLAQALVRLGLPNHVLTLAERVPGLTLPLLVTVVLSAHANAAWYAAWMMAWAAYVIPVQVGMTAFAEIARQPDRFVAVEVHALRTSLLLGCAAAGGLLLFAEPLLSLMGPGYAADAATALRILALAVFPMCFVYAYFAACRALRVPQRAIGFGWINVAVTLAAAALAGSGGGLTAIAASWTAVQTAFGLAAAWRLWQLANSVRPLRDDTRELRNELIGWLEDDEQLLCLARAEFKARDAGPPLHRNRRDGREPGVLALTERRVLFKGEAGSGVALARSDAPLAWVDHRSGGRPDLLFGTGAGFAIVPRVPPELEAAAAGRPPPAGAEARRSTFVLPSGETMLSVGIATIAAVAWASALARVDLAQVGDLGLVEALPLEAFLALALMCGGFALAISRPRVSTSLLALYVAVLVFMLHGATSLFEQVPSFSVTWRHAGVAAYISETGGVDPSINAYFNWPGFFALAALAAETAGLDSAIGLARWAPLVLNLLYLPALLLLVRAVSDDRRLPWAAAWMFYLANWVHQDYLSPQGLILVLYLGFVAVALRWLGGPPVAARQRAALICVCFLFLLAAVPSHQLTPLAMLAAATALVLVRASAARLLPTIALVLATGWLVFAAGPYLSGHIGDLREDVGQVSSTVSSSVGARVRGSEEHVLVAYLRIASAAVMWALAAAGAAKLLLEGRRRWRAHAALALAPFSLLLLQAYGGEILLRIYLFSLPFVAGLAAALLLGTDGRPRPRTPVLVAAVSALLATGFLFTRYGNEQVNLFTPSEVRLIERVQRSAPPGSVLVAPSANLPWQSHGVGDLRYRPLHRELGDRGRRPLADAVAGIMQHPEAPTGYLLITTNTREYERMFGAAPWGTIAELEQAVRRSPRFRLIHAGRNGDVYTLRPGSLARP